MRALVYDAYGGPEVLQIRDLAIPAARVGEVLIRVRAATVAPGDCKARGGLLTQFFAASFPKIPGRYGAGEVVKVADGVDYARAGDRVVFGTGHAESGSCVEFIARSREAVARAPAGLSDARAAAVVHAGVNAFVCVCEAGGVTRGTQVLVHGGAGAVGGACVELAAHRGAVVTATCRSSDCDYVQVLGARRAIAFDREDFSHIVADQDVVIDTQGGDVHERSYRVLKRNGRLVYLNAAPIRNRGAEHGVAVVNAGVVERHAVLDAVARLVEQGALRPRVAKVLPLAAAAEAHRLVESGAFRRGRVVLALD
jgi:NADPH:quinone reductase-like Zn-dependent oxidoreductase